MGGKVEWPEKLGWRADRTPFSSQTSQWSCRDEPGVLSTQSFLEEEDTGSLAQQQQATSTKGSEPLSSLDLSHEALVDLPSSRCLPFFRTYGLLLAEDEWAPQPEVCQARGRDWDVGGVLFQKDLEPPSGFFPYYRSKEENFPSLECEGSQDPPTSREVRAGCFCRRTVGGGSSVSAEGQVEGPQQGARAPGGPGSPSDLCPGASDPGSQANLSPQLPGLCRGSPEHCSPLLKGTEAGGRQSHSIPALPLAKRVAWRVCLSL